MKIDASKLRALAKARGLTNDKLAIEAGISRQALQMILREGQVIEVREKTVKGLAQALRLPDESLLSPDPLAGYKQAVAEDHADLTFRGLGLPTTEPRPMDEVYVPIRARRVPDREHDHDCRPSKAETEDEAVEESDELTVANCLKLYRRVLIRGEPGSGKTTEMRHAARACARGLDAEGSDSKQPRVPLMVRLADFAKARERNSEMTLVRFVVTCTLRGASPDYWTQVEHHIGLELKRGGCLVLLDGLDEVGGCTTLTGVVREFVDQFARNRFVLTSRIVGLDAGPWRKLGFATFQVARWRPEDIRAFARRWYAVRPAKGNKQLRKQLELRADEFTDAILNHPSLQEIASNPLMLTILAALHHANAALPRRRSDLYAKIVEVMLESWEASKRQARPGDPLHGIELEGREFGWLLERLALGMQREGRLLRPQWWVNDVVQQFLRGQMALNGDQVKEQSERVVRYLCERTGLLVERGAGMFGFWHRTFQEYFAARGLLLETEGGDIVSMLRPYLFHPQWEEVVVHVAASLSSPRATTLLRVILDDHEPAGRFLRRGRQLAMRCLVDGAAVADRALIDQVFSDGTAIGASRWLGITIKLIDLLRQLLVTRHATEARRMLGEIEDGAKQELPAGDYVTVYSSLHELPDGPRNGVPGTVCRKRLGRRQVELIWPAWEKLIDNPKTWYAEALQALRNPNTESKPRIALISFLGAEADSNDEARNALEDLLVRDREPTIRAGCAAALEGAAATSPGTANLLLSRLRKDDSDLVRKRCAAALRSVAGKQPEARDHLKALFTSATDVVRAGAAEGLSQLDFHSPEQKPLLEQFLATIRRSAESSRVRCACLWAISSLLGNADMENVDQTVEGCLEDPDPNVSRVALHILADAIADGRREWPQPLLERIEKMLTTVPDPCPHLYGDLVVIVAMKEMRGGQHLERLLTDALAPVADRITIAFVFGSVARLEQVRESDIDLMVVGDVRLKDLATPLHAVEQTLGRPVNPVVFSPDKFREQYREGNPFLLDVVRKEKIFLKGSADELTKLVADRSLD